MANKTIDRKKAIAARSQAAKASPKSVSARGASPAVGDEEEANLTQTASERGSSTDVLDAEAEEAEELEGEEEAQDDESEEEAEVVEEDEPRALDKTAERRAAKRERREQSLATVSSPDYAISRTRTAGESRLAKNGMVRFVQSSYRELRMVTWPSRQDTWNWSLVVVGVCLVVGVVLGATDLGLAQFVKWWISLAH